MSDRVVEHAADPRVLRHGALRLLLGDYLALSKIRLSSMVVITTAVGFIVGSYGGIEWLRLLGTVTGTLLAAIGASAFNQALEAGRDGRMERTRTRPIPAGRMSRRQAALFGLWTSVIGLAILCPTANGLTALLGLANILIYVLIYTPLKGATTLNTLVGGLVGALPPVMGWTAASNSVPAAALLLGALLFMWQIPHFLALAWMYRADYARGGYRMLPVVDPTGRKTALFAILYSLALIPIGVALLLTGATGAIFAVGAAGLGVWLFMRSVVFARDRTDAAARKLFLCSVAYLPLLLMIMVVDAKHPGQPRMVRTPAAITDSNAEMTPEQAHRLMQEAQAGRTAVGASTTQP